MSPISCVAVVGPSNHPLYIQTFQSENKLSGMQEDPIKFHYILHCSLDAFEEKASSGKKSQSKGDMYLGLLYPTEDYKVFGYLTGTNVKLILVADSFNAKEAVVKKVFRDLHSAYIDAVSNPFYNPGKKIESKSFEQRVDRAVNSAGLAHQ